MRWPPPAGGLRQVNRMLFTGYTVVLVLSASLFLLAMEGLGGMVHLQDRLLTEFNTIATQVDEMEDAVDAMLADTRGYLATADGKFLLAFRQDHQVFRRAADAIRVYMDMPAERRLFSAVLAGEHEVRAVFVRQIEILGRGGSIRDALAIVTARDRAARVRLRIGLVQLSGLAERESSEEIGKLYVAQTTAMKIFAVITLAGLLFGLAYGAWWARRLGSLYQELDRLNRLRSEFLAIASHDLRSPLTTVSGVVQLLQAAPGGFSEDQTRLLTVLKEESERMRRLVETYLDLTLLQEGTLRMAREPVDLAVLVTRHVDRIRSQFDQRGVGIEVTDTSGGLWVRGDGVRLTQVVDNLLTNALKFSPVGGRVRVGLMQSGSRAIVVIGDEGPGLTEVELQTIFEKFVQGEAGRRVRAGLGLGLAVSREIAFRHGGRLWAESEGPGRGSRFVLELPVSVPDAAGRETSPARPG